MNWCFTPLRLAQLRENSFAKPAANASVCRLSKTGQVFPANTLIPLLEYLDREHITKRDGDERVVIG